MKKTVLKGAGIVLPDRVVEGNLLVEGQKIAGIVDLSFTPSDNWEVVDLTGKVLLPGVVDPHVHMWDPGFTNYREDWFHGSQAAASGGITTIIEMPLSIPPVTDAASFQTKLETAKTSSHVDFAFWGGLTPNCVNALPEMDKLGCVAYKGFMSFCNDEYPQITDGYLIQAMQTAKSFNGLVGVHAENAEISDFGSKRMEAINCQDEAQHDAARPWWAELEAIQRAILFSENMESRLYICHMTIPEGAEVIKKAKYRGNKIYVETCPHYLLFDNTILREKKAYAKCNPPMRSRERVEQLWKYIFDGTIDTIGSDHGPYTDEDKEQNGSFWKEYSGFGGYDAMLAALIDEGVHKRGLPLPRLAALLSGNVAKAMDLYPKKGNLLPGADADIVVLDMDREWVYDGAKSFSKNQERQRNLSECEIQRKNSSNLCQRAASIQRRRNRKQSWFRRICTASKERMNGIRYSTVCLKDRSPFRCNPLSRTSELSS